MEEIKNNLPDKNNAFAEEDAGFDIMEWVLNFLHYWYLFVIGVIISLGLAYLQNRKIIPTYKSAGTLIIQEKESGYGANQALMQGFGVQAAYKNSNNQIIMLGSNDLIGRVVDSLPKMKVDFISKGNFKVRNLYSTSPVYMQVDYIAPEAYDLLFRLELHTNGTYFITVEENKQFKDFKLMGQFGVPIQHNLFFMNLFNVGYFSDDQVINFRFRSRESLISDFQSRVLFTWVTEGSSVLEISLASDTPERDVDFINQLAKTYLEDNLDMKNDAANKTMKFIDGQLSGLAQSLSESEDKLTDFRQKNKIVDVNTHTSDLLGKSVSFDNELSNLRLRETYLDYLAKYLKTNMDDGDVIAPSSLGLNEPMLMALVTQINTLNLQRGELNTKNPYYAKYTNDLNNVKKAINEVVKNMRVSLEIEKSDYYKRLSKVENDIEGLPKLELEMKSIERKYKMEDNYYTFFLQKRAESEILKASNSPDNIILDKARIVAVTNADKKSKTTMMFLLFGLLIPAAFVIVKELMNGIIRSVKDVEKNSPFKLIGMVRHTQSKDPTLIAKNPRSSFTEMFRVIRTRIEFIVQRKKDIMIVITSGESGDGKTYFSVNLACVYAMASRKTLLIDMDIRKPSVNQRFNITKVEGVTNYLVGQCELNDVILKLPDVDFDILPAGTVPPNAGELIRSEKLIEMIQELKKKYEYIIIDTSPIGVVADAYALAMMADINLFVVRNNKTNKGFFKRLTEQLKNDNISKMYTIINDVSVEENRYSRYYSRKYTYGYGGGGYYGYNGYTSRKRKDASDRYFQYYQDDREL
jgi:tyrosine-protein kinase Etk/Wzc